MKMVLVGGEAMILQEIGLKELKQKDIAFTYRMILDSGERVNWGNINRAIMERWSKSGLIRIKEMAHRGKF